MTRVQQLAAAWRGWAELTTQAVNETLEKAAELNIRDAAEQRMQETHYWLVDSSNYEDIYISGCFIDASNTVKAASLAVAMSDHISKETYEKLRGPYLLSFTITEINAS